MLLWLNGQFAGTVELQVPSLSDPGYYKTANGTLEYAGWRLGTVLFPSRTLVSGLNHLQFSFVGDGPAPAAVAVKNLNLELRYSPPAAVPDEGTAVDSVPAPVVETIPAP